MNVPLRLRGLPFRVPDEDVYDFLAGYNVVPGSLKFKFDENGRKSGQAALLFRTKIDA